MAEKKKKRRNKNNEATWMVSNHAKLERRTKQHTEFGASASNGSRDMARTKVVEKKEKKKEKKNERRIANNNNNININSKNKIYTNNETGSWSPCMRPRSDPTKMKNSTQTTLPHFNFSITAELNDVTSRLIIFVNEEINETNWMVSNSAKLDRRTKQHTQFGVSASNGSRDMVQRKSWRKKTKTNRKKIAKRIGW